MEENKDLLNGSQPDENADSELDVGLDRELEQIAQTFREELQKAQDESEKDETYTSDSEDEISQSEDDISQQSDFDEESADLCVRCGENPCDKQHGENYEYCEQCREEMCRVPFGFSNILVAVVVCVAAIIAVNSFSSDFEGYYSVYKAKENADCNKLDSALVSYDEAISYFENKDIKAKRLYLESAEIIFKTMPDGTASMGEVSDRISKALSNAFYKLPVYKKYVDLRTESLALYGTMEQFYAIMNSDDYAGYSIDSEEMYDSVMAQIEALSGSELSVTSIDGETTETVTVDEAMLQFCRYMFAYTAGKIDEANGYLEKVYEEQPEYLWLYAYEKSMVDIKNGDFESAEKIAEAVIENNKEDPDGYCIYSTAARLRGDSDKALEWAQTGLSYAPDDAELLRMQAMAYVTAGNIDKADEVIDKAMENNAYGLLYYTAAVIKNEAGDTDTVDEIIAAVEDGGLTLTDRMNDYFDGKITAAQMFTEGTGDVE